MTRRTRYETTFVERRVTVQQLACDNCGTVTDIEPLTRPEGWCSMQRTIDGQQLAWDFDSFECLLGFVVAAGEDGPGTLLAQLEASVEAVKAERAGVVS